MCISNLTTFSDFKNYITICCITIIIIINMHGIGIGIGIMHGIAIHG